MDKKGHDFWRTYLMFVLAAIVASIYIGASLSSWIIGFASYFIMSLTLTPIILNMFINDND